MNRPTAVYLETMQKPKVMDELKYKAFIQESAVLAIGFKPSIRVLCARFYSKDILDRNVYRLSLTNISNESLVEQVLNALQERVKLNDNTFDIIVEVLYAITAMNYLAKRLQDRLRNLREKQVAKKDAQTPKPNQPRHSQIADLRGLQGQPEPTDSHPIPSTHLFSKCII